MRIITIEHANEICDLFNDKTIEEIRGNEYLMQANSHPCMDAPIARIANKNENEKTVRLNEYL